MIFRINGAAIEIDIRDVHLAVMKCEGEPLMVLPSVQQFLQSKGVEATISIAWQVWEAVAKFGDHIKAKTQLFAELAYWYKLDPSKLTEEQQLGLSLNLDRMKCQDRIYRGDYNPIDYQGIYNLYMAAYGNEDLAHKKKAEAFARYVDSLIKAKQ